MKLFTCLCLITLFSYGQENKVRMAFMGNSITSGAGLTNPTTECYPTQLGLLLADVYGDTCEIKNYGVSGRTMMRSAENPLWKESQFPAALKYVPDICVIFLGTNDAKPYRWDAWGEEFLPDYLAMIDTFKYRNPNTKFIVCSPTPIWEGHPYGTEFSNFHNDSVLVNYVIPAIDSAATLRDALLVDLHTAFVDSLHYFPDKLHPNASGAKKLAGILFDKIQQAGLIHQVERGLAYVSVFETTKATIPQGGGAQLKWTTLWADSVYLDGVAVDLNGSMDIVADSNHTYELKVKGPKNTSSVHFNVNTYVPVKSSILINASVSSYAYSEPVTLYAYYKDQYNADMTDKATAAVWSVTEGEGTFSNQTDTSVVFTPGNVSKVIVEVNDGDLTRTKTMNIKTTAIGKLSPYGLKVSHVYPNPVQKTLHLDITARGEYTLQVNILDVSGKEISSSTKKPMVSGSHTVHIDVSALSKGVYMFSVHGKREVVYGKFIKE